MNILSLYIVNRIFTFELGLENIFSSTLEATFGSINHANEFVTLQLSSDDNEFVTLSGIEASDSDQTLKFKSDILYYIAKQFLFNLKEMNVWKEFGSLQQGKQFMFKGKFHDTNSFAYLCSLSSK